MRNDRIQATVHNVTLGRILLLTSSCYVSSFIRFTSDLLCMVHEKRTHLDKSLIKPCVSQRNTARVTSMRMTHGWQTVSDLQPDINSSRSNPILVLFSIRLQLPTVRTQAATIPRIFVKNRATRNILPTSQLKT